LEVGLSIAELYRVLKPGGFAYLADAGFQPCIGYLASRFGFDVFTSKASQSGLPVGTLLYKRPRVAALPSDLDLFNSDKVQHHVFNSSTSEVFLNCNLLFDFGDIVATPADELEFASREGPHPSKAVTAKDVFTASP
jgi:hypothetical protein